MSGQFILQTATIFNKKKIIKPSPLPIEEGTIVAEAVPNHMAVSEDLFSFLFQRIDFTTFAKYVIINV